MRSAPKLSDARVGTSAAILTLARIGLAIDAAYLLSVAVFVTRLQVIRLVIALGVLLGTAAFAAALLRQVRVVPGFLLHALVLGSALFLVIALQAHGRHAIVRSAPWYWVAVGSCTTVVLSTLLWRAHKTKRRRKA